MKEALKLALEVLQLVSIEFVCNGAHHAKKDRHDWLESCPIVERYQAAITAIKEALAQDEKGLFIDLIAQHEGLAEELAQPEQEPVGTAMADYTFTVKADSGYQSTTEGRCTADQYGQAMAALHTTPPKEQRSCDKRPWVGLTDEFCITNMFDMGHHSLQIVFKSRKNADEFKAALKKKNT